MSSAAIFVLITLGVASILLIADVLRADLVALLVLGVLGISGVLSPQEAF